jgi:head-tail adaptor
MFVHPYKVDQVDQHLSKSIFCMEVLLVAIISLWGFLGGVWEGVKFKFVKLRYKKNISATFKIPYSSMYSKHWFISCTLDQHLSKSIFCMEVLLVAIISLWGFLLLCQLSPLEGFYYHVMCDVINVKLRYKKNISATFKIPYSSMYSKHWFISCTFSFGLFRVRVRVVVLIQSTNFFFNDDSTS